MYVCVWMYVCVCLFVCVRVLGLIKAALVVRVDAYVPDKDHNAVDTARDLAARKEVLDPMFSKGQSKRIWGELYKVTASPAISVSFSLSLWAVTTHGCCSISVCARICVLYCLCMSLCRCGCCCYSGVCVCACVLSVCARAGD
jgi:hypothetical protein